MRYRNVKDLLQNHKIIKFWSLFREPGRCSSAKAEGNSPFEMKWNCSLSSAILFWLVKFKLHPWLTSILWPQEQNYSTTFSSSLLLSEYFPRMTIYYFICQASTSFLPLSYPNFPAFGPCALVKLIASICTRGSPSSWRVSLIVHTLDRGNYPRLEMQHKPPDIISGICGYYWGRRHFSSWGKGLKGNLGWPLSK